MYEFGHYLLLYVCLGGILQMFWLHRYMPLNEDYLIFNLVSVVFYPIVIIGLLYLKIEEKYNRDCV